MSGRLSLTLARSYYALAGLIAAAAGVGTIIGAAMAGLNGCTLVFRQADFAGPPTTGPIAETLPSCQQFVDLLAIGIELAVAAALIATAVRFGATSTPSRIYVRAGALLGIAVGALPPAFLWWLMDYYDQTADPISVTIALLPLAAGLAAAWVTWRAHGIQHVEHREDPAAV